MFHYCITDARFLEFCASQTIVCVVRLCRTCSITRKKLGLGREPGCKLEARIEGKTLLLEELPLLLLSFSDSPTLPSVASPRHQQCSHARSNSAPRDGTEASSSSSSPPRGGRAKLFRNRPCGRGGRSVIGKRRCVPGPDKIPLLTRHTQTGKLASRDKSQFLSKYSLQNVSASNKQSFASAHRPARLIGARGAHQTDLIGQSHSARRAQANAQAENPGKCPRYAATQISPLLSKPRRGEHYVQGAWTRRSLLARTTMP